MTAAFSKSQVRGGLQIRIALEHDSWEWFGGPPPPVDLRARQDAPRGWNETVAPFVTFAADGGELVATVPGSPRYDVDAVEIVDIFQRASTSANRERRYVGNITVQGSSASENDHHDYHDTLVALRDRLFSLRQAIHRIKLSVSQRPPAAAAAAAAAAPSLDSFAASDDLLSRLRKLNSTDRSHPLSICKPPLIHGVQSSALDTYMGGLLQSLSLFRGEYALSPNRRCVPVLLPRLERHQAPRFHTILLSRSLSMTLRLSSQLEARTFAPAHAHIVHLTGSDTVTISGAGIATVSFEPL